MGIIKKQGILNTIIAYAGIPLGFINTLLLYPRFLDPDQVGLIRFLPQAAVMFAQFSALGLTNTSLRYFPFYRSKENQHHGFLFLMLAIPLLGFACITALFLLFKEQIISYYIDGSEMVVEYYYFVIPLAFFSLLFILLEAYLKSLYKTVVSSFIQDFLLRILISITVIIYALDLINFHSFVLLFIGVYSLSGFILVVYLMWLKQLFILPHPLTFKIKPIGEVMMYGMFAFLGNVSTTIITTTDTLMIGAFLNLTQVGIYTISVFVAAVVMVPARSFYKIAYPKVAELWKDKDMKGLEKLYKDISLLNLLIGLFIFTGIWANIDNIYLLMTNPVYAAGKYVVLFIGMACLFDMASGINGMILITSEKYRYDLVFNFALVVFVIYTNYLFIPLYGITGAAMATFATYVIVNILRLLFVKYHFKMQPFTLRSLFVIGIALAAFFAAYLVPEMPHFLLDIFVRSTVVTVVYGSLVLTTKISPQINDIIRNTLKRFIR